MVKYQIEQTTIHSDGKKATVISVNPNPENVRSNPVNGTAGGVFIPVDIGEDENAKAALEKAIDDFVGYRPFNRFNGDGNPYSVIILESVP